MNLKNEIIAVVKDAGEIMLQATKIEEAQHEKSGDYNLFTEYDVAVQNYLFEQLAKILPEAKFIGEEEDAGVSKEEVYSGYSFIIDPIDGTTNFIHDYQMSSISVALLKEGEVFIGVVYNPYNKDLFSAQQGEGAYLNETKIFATKKSLPETLLAFGTAPYYRDTFADKTFATLQALFPYCQDLRRSGSAALDICYVACGRTGLFFEHILSPWDYAAAALILQEAGGMITDMEKHPLPFHKTASVLAAGTAAYEDYFRYTR
ncbi:MAG: inositol monophosphatase family protein [Christensenellaceae bacterium]|jgi:myo-inositol-1(or 4)-monophosphatase